MFGTTIVLWIAGMALGNTTPSLWRPQQSNTYVCGFGRCHAPAQDAEHHDDTSLKAEHPRPTDSLFLAHPPTLPVSPLPVVAEVAVAWTCAKPPMTQRTQL